MPQAIAGSRLEINNEALPYEDLFYKTGNPEVTVSAFATGDGNVETVPSPDLSTAISMVTVEISASVENRARVENYLQNRGAIGIKIIFPVDGVEIFENMSLINQPEFGIKPDARVTLEFKGSPSQQG